MCVCVYCWQPALIGFSLYWQPAIVTFFLHWQINFFFFFYCKSSQVISVKLTVMTNGTNRLSFGSDPVLGTDFGSLFHFPQHCRIAHFMRFNSICHTVTGRFWRHSSKWLTRPRCISDTLEAMRRTPRSGSIGITVGWDRGVSCLWVLYSISNVFPFLNFRCHYSTKTDAHHTSFSLVVVCFCSRLCNIHRADSYRLAIVLVLSKSNQT